jgi:hypothetical protein
MDLAPFHGTLFGARDLYSRNISDLKKLFGLSITEEK